MKNENKVEIQCGERLTPRAHFLRSALTSGPALLWLAVFFLAPLLAVLFISFLTRGVYGELQWPLTLENYKRLIGFGPFGFDSLYPLIFLKSLALGALTVFLCALAGFPLAFFIANLSPRFKTAALILVVIPFWTNLLIRTYAWQILLAPESGLARLAATPLCSAAPFVSSSGPAATGRSDQASPSPRWPWSWSDFGCRCASPIGKERREKVVAASAAGVRFSLSLFVRADCRRDDLFVQLRALRGRLERIYGRMVCCGVGEIAVGHRREKYFSACPL